MCGIAGFFGAASEGTAVGLLDSFNSMQSHRGPDDAAIWLEEAVGLAHTRLAIIDLHTGQQPMLSTDGRYAIVLNGEIYNHRQLRSELAAKGYSFRTGSDTEIIPAALEAWGLAEGLRRLRGMFALAIYDRRDRTLTLARDRFGIKPLYVAVSGPLVMFASEMKALLNTGLLPRFADSAGLVDFLTVGATVSPRTCWTAIEELVPGMWTKFDTALLRSSGRFAETPDTAVTDDHERDEVLLERVESALVDSCRHHLESDVPVAAFLSGGIDSSLLVAILAKIQPGLQTFHVKFAEAGYDESPYARRVAEHCGTRHRELELPSHQGTIEQLAGILEQWDQPFGDSSLIPTWLVTQEMSKHVKVAISGDGGDEIFGGYTRYASIRQMRALGRIPLAQPAARLAASLVEKAGPDLGRQLRKFATMSGMDPVGQLMGLHTYFDSAAIQEIFCPEVARVLASAGPSETRVVSPAVRSIEDPTNQLARFEMESMLHGDYLRKVDVSSSAHGLEVRTPFLDQEVATVGARLPLRLKLGRGQFKRALRLVAARYLPSEVINKPKWGFGVPFDTWLKPSEVSAVRGYLLGPLSLSRDWLHRAPVERLLDRFEHGGSRLDLSRYQVYQRVFMLISLESWLRRWHPDLRGIAA
jgi:asparagine synthase (glutamine-hydrolysing)